ncbi:MAG: hypothetical protein OHK0022_13580 [Roseiflexaceae bacterium]
MQHTHEQISESTGAAVEQATPLAGTLFRGADGELYFIPDDYLKPFQVAEGVESQVEGMVEEANQPGMEAIYTTVMIHDQLPADANTNGIIIAMLRYEPE